MTAHTTRRGVSVQDFASGFIMEFPVGLELVDVFWSAMKVDMSWEDLSS